VIVVIVLLPISTVFVSTFGDSTIGNFVVPQEVKRNSERSKREVSFITEKLLFTTEMVYFYFFLSPAN
jgi:hypothetical protein